MCAIAGQLFLLPGSFLPFTSKAQGSGERCLPGRDLGEGGRGSQANSSPPALCTSASGLLDKPVQDPPPREIQAVTLER